MLDNKVELYYTMKGMSRILTNPIPSSFLFQANFGIATVVAIVEHAKLS